MSCGCHPAIIVPRGSLLWRPALTLGTDPDIAAAPVAGCGWGRFRLALVWILSRVRRTAASTSSAVGVGAAALDQGKHAGVGVGGDDDAGVAEQVLQGLEVRACLVRERGGAVAEIVEPDRRDVDLPGQEPESAAGVAGVDR
jgi:hypothetical protein